MRRLVVPVVVVLGLVLGGAIAGWPSRVKSDVVIETVPTTTVP